VDDATGWAERGLKVSKAQSGQECDESCGVILYNLGMLHEVMWFVNRTHRVTIDRLLHSNMIFLYVRNHR
jgi:hypothetical protein